jgi:fluoride exporter
MPAALPPAGPAARDRLAPADLALVFAGGALGTLARAAVATAVPSGSWPWSTLTVNLLGTALLTVLVVRAPAARRMRILFGTGALGAFTTYSAFAVEIATHPPAASIVYAFVTVAGGLVVAALVHRLLGRTS